ncbi:MFS transporter [Actinoplanes utahensis]|uniref:MFS transporter n=1 Tax=Actinoplanes utahensis TaxID=1869 RepID=UPI000691B99C|nr:MFS transporter [Actinoplanes utahensis]GIF33429.1 MFS transporter [Actinoplanes utahensis]
MSRDVIASTRAGSPGPGRSRRSVSACMLVVLTIDSLAAGSFAPLALLYLTESTDAPVARIGLLLTVANLIALPLPLWVGRLVDRWGAKPVVLVSQVLQAAAFAGYVFASGTASVLVVATVMALGWQAFWASIYALISNFTDGDPDPRARDRWLGISGALRAGGYGVGAAIAGVALSVGSLVMYNWLVGGLATLIVIAAILVLAGVPGYGSAPAEAVEGRGYRVLLHDGPFLSLISLNTLYALCNMLLSVGFPLYVATAMPGLTWAVGPLLVMNTVVQAVLQPAVVRWTRHLSRHVPLVLAGLLWAGWSLATLGARHVPAALAVATCAVAILCYSAAQMLHAPASTAMAADASPADVRGRYLASFQYSFSIANMVAPLMFSTLLAVGPDVPWLVIATCAVATVPLLMVIAPRLPAVALTGARQSSQ